MLRQMINGILLVVRNNKLNFKNFQCYEKMINGILLVVINNKIKFWNFFMNIFFVWGKGNW